MANQILYISNADILTAIDGYGLQPPISTLNLPGLGTNNQTIALQSQSGSYVWRTYQTHTEPETIDYEHKLLTWLDVQPTSFVVPAPIAMADGATLYRNSREFKALFPLVRGEVPDRTNPKQMESVGAALGELHRTLETYPQVVRPGLASYSAIEQVHPHIPDPAAMTPEQMGLSGSQSENALFDWWRTEVNRVQAWKSINYKKLPHQVIHGDYTPANSLVVGDTVSAVLDFDFALFDARMMDVAAGLFFTMRTWENSNPWLIADAFCRGYRRWIQLTEAEIAALPWLMQLRSAVSIVWWFGKEAAAGKPIKLWRIEDLQHLVGWLEENDQRLSETLRK
ncbi:MAG: phosphotransferase [Chloroflexota bacterium]